MNARKKEPLIRGWLPKDPIRLSQGNAGKPKPIYLPQIFKKVIVVLVVAAGLLCSLVFLADSWIKILFIAAGLMGCLVFYMSHGKAKSAVKYTVVALMIFSLCFTAFEGYLFSHAGVPPTYTQSAPINEISSEIGNASLTNLLQTLEKSDAFSLLKSEFPGNWEFQSMLISISHSGYFDVRYYSETSKEFAEFRSHDGQQFSVRTSHQNGGLTPLQKTTNTLLENSLRQIDAVGLGWFYSHALKIAHNRTDHLPDITGVQFSLYFIGGNATYQGLTLQIIGGYPANAHEGTAAVWATFQSDGTMMTMWAPETRS